MSPEAGSPQRSMPTTPSERYLVARSTTSRAVARLFLRSMDSIRLVFRVEVLLEAEIQDSTVQT